jgi:hypothetical protein
MLLRRPAPAITITDCSRTASGEEVDWRESFLQNALDARIPNKNISEETETVIDILKQAYYVLKRRIG